MLAELCGVLGTLTKEVMTAKPLICYYSSELDLLSRQNFDEEKSRIY